nr:hypothetical protein [Tanacetum cinerariifolium]
MNDVDDRWNKMIVSGNKIIQILGKMAANLSAHSTEPSRWFNSFCCGDNDDYDYEESTIPLNEIISQIPSSIVITTSPPVKDPGDSLIMEDEDLSTIPEKEIDEVIKSSVEDLVPIPSESEDTSGSDSEYDLSLCDDFSPINVLEGNSVTFSNPLFEFDDEYISSDVNPIFDEVLEDIEGKVSYESNLDEPTLLVTPIAEANEDECFNSGGDVDEINVFDIPSDFKDGFYDSEGIALLPQHLTNQAMLEFEAFKTYHAYATGEKIPKPKYAKNKADPESSPTKKSAQASKAKRLKTSAKVALSEAEQMKLATKRSKVQFHSSHVNGSGADEGTGVIPGVPDVPTYDSEDEHISWKSSDEDGDDEVNISEDDDDQNDDNDDDEEERHDDDDDKMDDSFDPRVQTPSHVESPDEDYDEVTQGDVHVTMNVEIPPSSATTLPLPPIPLIQPQYQTIVPTRIIVPNFLNKLDENIKKIIKEQVKVQVKEQVTKILLRIEKFVNKQLEYEVLACLSNEAKTSHAVAANLSELELKKILIDKMKSKKSIHRSVQQKTLYKALIDAYETNKVILDTYGDTVTIKRRQEDEDDDEEPSAGSNRGSKRRRTRKEPESTNFSALVMNRLKVDTLALELLAGPTFELMKGYCKSLVELEYFLEEVYKATTDQLDWNNPEGRNDDKLYTFKEGDYKRLLLHDIEDMLLLLTQAQEQKDHEEPGKICGWETVRGRLSAAGKDHMIYHMMSSS